MRDRMLRLVARLHGAVDALHRGVDDLAEDERGDVPGWVLITLMTAGLVVVIWAVAGPALADLFDQALKRVSGAGL